MENPTTSALSEKKAARIQSMIDRIDGIIEAAIEFEKKYEKELAKVHPKYEQSARNLIHYRALRSQDLNDLQKGLGNMGLSRLARVQGNVLRSLYTNREILVSFLGGSIKNVRKGISVKKGNRLSKTNAKTLLGYRSKGRRTRIMVTLPSVAADDYSMVKNMIEQGMNCARINCAHDDQEAWARMIDHVHKASEKLKNRSNVMMDLAGPKIRTGALVLGPKVRKYRPEKNERGEIIEPLTVCIGDKLAPESEFPHIPIFEDDLEKLETSVTLYFRDARGKKRTLEVGEQHADGFLAFCPKTTYLETGTPLFLNKEMEEEAMRVGELPNVEMPILLCKSDILRINRKPVPGGAVSFDKNGKMVAVAHISCTAPEVFGDTKIGDPILFDDGKIGGIIKSINEEYAEVEITNAAATGTKLRADKGINFPSSELSINGLTEKDKVDLEFVAKNTDVINLSFVNSPEDVKGLLSELKRLDAKEGIGLILKIETQRGFNQLTEILLEAMQMYPVGVMIARGDLAVECGWKNIGRVQDEILSICQAAHVTDIWATQVLESLAKKGIPSRAEITDVIKAQEADCVMLNKGTYIMDSIRLLDTILKDMDQFREKNMSFLPALSKADTKK